MGAGSWSSSWPGTCFGDEQKAFWAGSGLGPREAGEGVLEVRAAGRLKALPVARRGPRPRPELFLSFENNSQAAALVPRPPEELLRAMMRVMLTKASNGALFSSSRILLLSSPQAGRRQLLPVTRLVLSEEPGPDDQTPEGLCCPDKKSE